ncbi:BnaC04g50210D [Brassica napus]|uniref:BnaC04g50210D protein n=2 Tax=Brassica napus TaxID=3708 RepID=A0A078GQA4_BRANA|nr:BnaC04g50210D [Brassica napus]
MLAKSGVLKKYESVIKKGLTVFAPSDEAFKAKDVPDPTKLTKANMVSLLEYHALAHYKPKGSLKSNKNKVSTLATTGAGNFDLTTSTSGDEVVLHTGIASSRLVHTVLDATPVVIFTVDNVLLPTELFGNSHSPAPVPALSPAEGASPTAPSPSEPPTDESPESSHSNSSKGLANSKSANAAVAVSSPSLFTALVTLATIAVFQLVETF